MYVSDFSGAFFASTGLLRIGFCVTFFLLVSCDLWAGGCLAGVEGGIVVAKCENKDWGYGYNAATGEYLDLLVAGVLDPAKVNIPI